MHAHALRESKSERWLQYRETYQARGEQDQPRVKKQPARTKQQQESKMPPAVAPCAQVRTPVPPIGPQCGRNLFDFDSSQRCLSDHFAGEFHARADQPQAQDGFAREAAQPAVEIADIDAEEK